MHWLWSLSTQWCCFQMCHLNVADEAKLQQHRGASPVIPDEKQLSTSTWVGNPSSSLDTFFFVSIKLKLKLWICSSYLLLSHLNTWRYSINSVLTLSLHLPQLHYPDRSSPLNRYLLTALLPATFSFFFFLFFSLCSLAVEEETEPEPTGSLEASFSGTWLHKPCNLFITVSTTGAGFLKRVHMLLWLLFLFLQSLSFVWRLIFL